MAATLICAVTLPMTIAMLIQIVLPEFGTAVSTWILALVIVLHITGFACYRLPRIAFGIGAAAMLSLALTAAPGSSSAALLPSATTFILLEWQMGSTQRRGVAGAALGVGIVGAGIITAVDAISHDLRDPILIAFEAMALVAVVAAGWAFGVWSRQRRAASAARAEQRVHDALAAERTRIGRDLHDVVSHSLTIMIAQAEAARVLAREPQASHALERVAETGRSAMHGLRRMLHVLDDGESDPGLSPSPDLRGLARLVEGTSTPEHRTSFVERGEPRTMRPDAELAVFRAAQEALTNVVRHVRPLVQVRVELGWSADEVVLSVTDDGGEGTIQGSAGVGVGLIGMAERVRQAGGALDVQQGSGWTVRVSMPIEEDA
ncbi:hypothetical protein ASG80_17375 [Agromyces sp. Soil535]|nr:hypothetical protein ASG80_17375 [Agromyces sp. Soil535]